MIDATRPWRVRAASGALGLVVLLVMTSAGCGYSLRGSLPSHIRTVGVPIFQNHTPQPAIEGFITRAVVEAFSTNGRLRVVHPDDADSVLDGEITDYTLTSIAFDPRANVQQYRLTLTLNLRFRDVREKKTLFEQVGFSERADFLVASAVAGTISREEAALTQAAVDIARTIVSLAVERF